MDDGAIKESDGMTQREQQAGKRDSRVFDFMLIYKSA